jgi:imidazolonepropionase
MTDLLLSNVHLATMDNGYGLLHDAALAVKDGRIAWIGARHDAPPAAHEHDCGGAWLTPGLIDCHTHIVHGGNRSNEWEARLNGATYEDIARQGGGIMATVRATRALDIDALVAASLPRVKALLAEGVTTLEIKSGYGLALDAEERMLRAARRIGELLPVRVVTTFLGAHALPPEFAGRPDDYISDVCDVMLPALAEQGLVDAVDAFCERIGFTNAQTALVFDKAGALGLPVKLHAEQLSDQGGAALVARHGGCCRVPITICAKRPCHRSPPCAPPACRWPWPPTAIPAPRR